jgi:hypothetical protein
MAPATQTRVVVKAFNPADPTSTLAVEEAPLPALKAGDVLVRVTARPVNPADVFSIMVRAAQRRRGVACRRALPRRTLPRRSWHLYRTWALGHARATASRNCCVAYARAPQSQLRVCVWDRVSRC